MRKRRSILTMHCPFGQALFAWARFDYGQMRLENDQRPVSSQWTVNTDILMWFLNYCDSCVCWLYVFLCHFCTFDLALRHTLISKLTRTFVDDWHCQACQAPGPGGNAITENAGVTRTNFTNTKMSQLSFTLANKVSASVCSTGLRSPASKFNAFWQPCLTVFLICRWTAYAARPWDSVRSDCQGKPPCQKCLWHISQHEGRAWRIQLGSGVCKWGI